MKPKILALCAAAALSGCGAPPPEVPKLSEVAVGGPAADALPAPAESDPDGGFLDAGGTPAPQGAEARPRGGLLGFFKGRADAAKAREPDPAPAREGQGGGLLAGLFGGSGGDAPEPGAPDYRQVGPGTTLPFGEMARLCGTPERALGTRIATYPETGRPRYALYDSAPGSSAPRTLFVTGFGDGCARQVTGALALFGSPELHEELRYGAPSDTIPRTAIDSAYERVKSQVCRVASGKPCGRSMGRLEKDTAFVTIYPAFGSASYANMLLHDGEVAAFALP